MIIKRCFKCNKWFKANLLSYQSYCPRCRKIHWKYCIEGFKKTRAVLAAYMDVYDTKYPLEKLKRYERVCRVCGARLVKKDGSHSYHKRYCSKHNYSDFNTNWGFSRWNFLQNFKEKRRTSIILTAMDEGKEKIFRGSYNGEIGELQYYICEMCNKVMTYYEVEVHHKIPVHTLTEKNLHLIWDESNFMCIHHKCHNKIDHYLKKKIKKEKLHFYWRDKRYRNKKMDAFFQKFGEGKNARTKTI